MHPERTPSTESSHSLAPRIAAAALLLLTGCDVDTNELIDIRLTRTNADIDITCPDGCDPVRLEGVISVDDTAAIAPDANIEIQQYRVTYQLEGDPPPFNDVDPVVVRRGETQPFFPRVAGEAQIQWAAALLASGGELSGIGTLTVVVKDHQGVLIERALKFQVLFGDFLTTSNGAGGTTTTGPGSGGGGNGSGGAGGN